LRMRQMDNQEPLMTGRNLSKLKPSVHSGWPHQIDRVGP
jgi:hypothetical protein